MAEKVSTMDVRQRIGDMLNRVALRHDEFIIGRKGKALAALVPVERLEQMRELARGQIRAFGAEQKRAKLKLSDAEATALGLEAQRWARKRPKQAKAGRS